MSEQFFGLDRRVPAWRLRPKRKRTFGQWFAELWRTKLHDDLVLDAVRQIRPRTKDEMFLLVDGWYDRGTITIGQYNWLLSKRVWAWLNGEVC